MQAKEAAKRLRQTQIIGADRRCGSSTTDFTLVKSLYEIPMDFEE